MVARPHSPALPIPPSAYTAPNPTGAVVTTYAELAAEVALAGPRVIVVADGSYSGAGLTTNQGHAIWAQNQGEVLFDFGIGFRGNAGAPGGQVHGVRFAVTNAANVDATGIYREGIINTWDSLDPLDIGSGLLLEDCEFDGGSVVGSGVQAANPGGLTIRRCTFANFLDFGIFALRSSSDADAFDLIVIEDVTIEGVSDPVPGSLAGVREAGIYLGHRFELRRVSVVDCAWAGIGLVNEVHGWTIEDVTIDRVGWGYFEGGSVGIYCEHCHDGDIRRVDLGAEMKVGINLEWNNDGPAFVNALVPRNYDVRMEHVTTRAYKMGIHMDLSVAQCTIRSCRFERSWLAAILDNNTFPDDNGDFPAPDGEDPIVSTNVVDLETCSFFLEPSVPRLLHDHHGLSGLPPTIEGWGLTPALVDESLLVLEVPGRVHEAVAFRFFEFMTEKPNTAKVARIIGDRFQAIEEQLDLLGDLVPLDRATGSWLEVYGLILDLRRRDAWTEDDFRFFLQSKILALQSSGTWANIRAVARRMIPDTTDPGLVRIVPEYPRGYRLEVPDVPAAVRGLAVELVSIATQAGNRGVIVFYSSTSNFFSFRAPGDTHGLGAGRFAHSEKIVGTED